jgi:flagellar basal body-associated protein FliL
MSTALGWIVIAAGAVVTAATIVAAVFWTIRPGERDPLHPKYTILRKDR